MSAYVNNKHEKLTGTLDKKYLDGISVRKSLSRANKNNIVAFVFSH